MNNNPVRYTDPTGHWAGPAIHDSDGDSTTLLNNTRLYEALVDEGMFDLPEPDDVPCPEMCYTTKTGKMVDVRPTTHQQYSLFRKELFLRYGWRYITRSGKITDQALLAIIRWKEFGGLKGLDDAYGEAMEALSNQYHSTRAGDHSAKCFGDCTMEEQLVWLQIVQSFRGNKPSEYFDATGLIGYDEVADIVTEGPYGDSWMWGHVASLDEIPDTRVVTAKYHAPHGWFYVWHPR
jgi:hypothetical protein